LTQIDKYTNLQHVMTFFIVEENALTQIDKYTNLQHVMTLVI